MRLKEFKSISVQDGGGTGTCMWLGVSKVFKSFYVHVHVRVYGGKQLILT